MSSKKPDLVVWSEEKGYYPRELSYGSNLGAPSIVLDNVNGWKKDQIIAANDNFKAKYNELVKEFESLVEEVNWNTMVYSSQYNFIPIVGHTYHLYRKANSKLFLSIIEPSSWNMEYVASFKLNSDRKWIKT